MRRAAVIVLLLLFFALPVRAAQAQSPSGQSGESTGEDIYGEQYAFSGADSLKDALTGDARDYFEENGIDPADPGWVNTFTGENVFSHIFGFLKSGARTPLRAGAALLGIILITAAFSAVSRESGAFVPAVYASTLAAAAVVAAPVFAAISAAANAVRGIGVFMLAFVPVFAGVVALSGGTVTAVSMSALLLGAAEAVASVSAFAVLPFMGGYLAMSVCAGVSPLVAKSGVAEGVRKLAVWLMTFVSTVFVGILGIQTAVNSAADTVTMKTARFLLGTSVPVAGTALAEAVSTLTASLSLLRSSVGIYGVAAVAVILLPVLAELTVWRGVLTACAAAADLFSLPRLSGVLRAVDAMLSLLLGILLMTGAVFIVSLTVVVTFGRTT